MPGNNPYCIFLDLIGYSEKQFGESLYQAPGKYSGVLGYKELCLLANALKVFENNGYDQVYDWCRVLNESE